MTSDPFTVGRVVGGFRIERPLKDGGFGSVFVALQLKTANRCALKILRPIPDPKFKERWERECKIGAEIESDYIVRVIDAGLEKVDGGKPDEQEFPWIAMELLDGNDLEDVVRDRGALPLAEVELILLQTCHALGRAHEKSIVHRDLKPENLFLARTKTAKREPLIKILDFGIAKAITGSKSRTERIGTLGWLAPEQTDRDGRITPGTDVWAIGLIIFFLLTGKRYWLTCQDDDSVSDAMVLREMLFAELQPASARARELASPNELPPWFDAWFGGCVSRTNRFGDAAVAYEAFRAAFESARTLPVEVSPPPREALRRPPVPKLATPLPTERQPVASGASSNAPVVRPSELRRPSWRLFRRLSPTRLAAAGAMLAGVSVLLSSIATAPDKPLAEPAKPDELPISAVDSGGHSVVGEGSVAVAQNTEPAPDPIDVGPRLPTAPVTPPPPPSVPTPGKKLPQTLEAATVDAAQASAMAQCAASVRAQDEGVLVWFKLQISPAGNANVEPSDTLGSRDYGKCIVRVLEGKRFQQTLDGYSTTKQIRL